MQIGLTPVPSALASVKLLGVHKWTVVVADMRTYAKL
jgi:hypothetical protein